MKFQISEHKYFIQPGYLVIYKDPVMIYGVVGSGIFLGLWDEHKGFSGCCCFLYPKQQDKTQTTSLYGNIAIRHLIKKMRESGSNLHDLKAHILGGAHNSSSSVGEENKKMTIELLERFHIEIISNDTGGRLGRKFIYDTSTGHAVVLKTKQLRSMDWYPYGGN